jgi:hypothetical protein
LKTKRDAQNRNKTDDKKKSKGNEREDVDHGHGGSRQTHEDDRETEQYEHYSNNNNNNNNYQSPMYPNSNDGYDDSDRYGTGSGGSGFASSVLNAASSTLASVARGAAVAANSVSNGLSNAASSIGDSYRDSRCKSAVDTLRVDFDKKDYKDRLNNAVKQCLNAPNECTYVQDVYDRVHTMTVKKKNGWFKSDTTETVGDWFQASSFKNACQLE